MILAADPLAHLTNAPQRTAAAVATRRYQLRKGIVSCAKAVALAVAFAWWTNPSAAGTLNPNSTLTRVVVYLTSDADLSNAPVHALLGLIEDSKDVGHQPGSVLVRNQIAAGDAEVKTLQTEDVELDIIRKGIRPIDLQRAALVVAFRAADNPLRARWVFTLRYVLVFSDGQAFAGQTGRKAVLSRQKPTELVDVGIPPALVSEGSR